MSLTFCSGALSGVLGTVGGLVIAGKITSDADELPAAAFGEVAAKPADGGALCDTDRGSFESTAGMGGGGDGGEP